MSQAYKELGWVDGQVGERLPTMTEFADAVEAVEAGAKGKNARERLMPFTDFGLFRDTDDQVFDPTGGGNGLVIDLHGYKNEKVLRAASSFILRKIYREMFLWPQDSTMKLALVLDEAHRFAKDKTLPKLMKEGRKYGISCLVASQSISDFDKEVSGNAGTKIVFRTNFPESKKVAETVRGAGKNDLSKIIEQLNVGEAYVATPDQPVARKTRMIGDV
jgi:DNA helicase HerA-like ATPase